MKAIKIKNLGGIKISVLGAEINYLPAFINPWRMSKVISGNQEIDVDIDISTFKSNGGFGEFALWLEDNYPLLKMQVEKDVEIFRLNYLLEQERIAHEKMMRIAYKRVGSAFKRIVQND